MEDKRKPDNSYERILALESEVQKLNEKLKQLSVGTEQPPGDIGFDEPGDYEYDQQEEAEFTP
jgi:hypothetical protein